MKEHPKLPSWIRNRDLPFLDEKQLELISENEGKLKGRDLSFREFLLKHRTIIGISKRQYQALEKKKKEILRLQESLRELKQDSSSMWSVLVPFKEKYSFTSSTSSFTIKKKSKSGVKEYRYYQMTINRPNQNSPIKVFLGSEKVALKFLNKTYPSRKSEIKKDWVSFVNKLTNDFREKPYQYIQNLFITNPMKMGRYKTILLKKDDVFVK